MDEKEKEIPEIYKQISEQIKLILPTKNVTKEEAVKNVYNYLEKSFTLMADAVVEKTAIPLAAIALCGCGCGNVTILINSEIVSAQQSVKLLNQAADNLKQSIKNLN